MTENEMNVLLSARLDKLSLKEGDLLVATIDMDKYDGLECEEIYEELRSVALRYKSEILVLPVGCEVAKADMVYVEGLKQIITDWESKHKERDVNV